MPHRITPIDRRDRALEAAAPIIAFKQGALLTELMFPRISQALRYIIRNTTLPPRVRAEAQLQLAQMHSYTRGTQIRNRCIMGGQGRGVLRDFKMTRVRGLLDKTNLWTNKIANSRCSSSSVWRPWQETFLVSREQVGNAGGEF
jgi:ribosomal protein S14